MELLAFLVLGGLAGWIASMIMGTDGSQGIFLNVVVGVIGAFVGGLVFNAFGSAGVSGFNIYSLAVATFGAIVLLWLVRFLRRA
ncbi:MAG: transglycosylase [Parcubacteria group bacterium Athens0416_74]|nr:MAG: transglycosylase [Parcubacteria group bacterium Athens0416_74]